MRDIAVGRPLVGNGTSNSLARVRVMVVDDNAGFRESLLALLQAEELTVVGVADTGPRALELICELEPDVVLMDVRMPHMDGIETTRRMKALRPHVGVVALTGHDDQDVVRDMLVAGASGFVLKDSDGDDILNAVRQAARGGGLISPEVTPAVIEELIEALERERRRTTALEQAQSALVERAARRQEMVARLGHELRTPVTVIFGTAQTLAAGKASPEQKAELLDRLVERAAGLARLVERFEVAVDASITESADVRALAQEIADRETRVIVTVQGHAHTAHVNSMVARRILDELVDNALRFSPQDAPVEVRIRSASSHVEIRVVDRGAGIAPGDRDRVFEPLQQAESLNNRTHQGAGMGLSLARTAARAMDGDVILERSADDGSTFLWKVPLGG